MQFGLPNTMMDSLLKEGKYPIVDRLGWERSPYDQMAPLSALGSEIGWICDVSPSHSVWSSQSHSASPSFTGEMVMADRFMKLHSPQSTNMSLLQTMP